MRIWFDTEFIDTGALVHLLSIGMVREDGETYYAEPAETDRGLSCEWVAKNVLPHLSGPVKPRAQIAAELIAFCGKHPEFWTYYGSYDWLVLCQLYGRMLDTPPTWPHFPMDVQQLRCLTGASDLPKQTGTAHNALDDALWTRDAFHFLVSRHTADAQLIAAAREAVPALLDEVERLREACKEIARIRLATDEGTLRERADRMWSIAEDRK